jgi:hypothetical protein
MIFFRYGEIGMSFLIRPIASSSVILIVESAFDIDIKFKYIKMVFAIKYGKFINIILDYLTINLYDSTSAFSIFKCKHKKKLKNIFILK